MEEKVYKVMGGAGAMNIVLGVVMLVRPDVALQSLCLLRIRVRISCLPVHR